MRTSFDPFTKKDDGDQSLIIWLQQMLTGFSHWPAKKHPVPFLGEKSESASIPLHHQFGDFSELIGVSRYQGHTALESSDGYPEIVRAD